MFTSRIVKTNKQTLTFWFGLYLLILCSVFDQWWWKELRQEINIWMWRYLKTTSRVWHLPWVEGQHCDSQLPEVRPGTRTGNATRAAEGTTRCCPLSVGNTVCHTCAAGGGKKEGEKGRKEHVSEKQRQTGSGDLTTQCSQRFLQEKTDKERNTLFKAAFLPPNVSHSYDVRACLLHRSCHTAVTCCGLWVPAV